jgi:hypothetical protein
MQSIVADGLMVVRRPLKKEEPPSRGCGLFYTCALEQIRRSQLELCATLALRVKPVKCLRIFYVILISNKSYARQWNVERTLKIGLFLFMILLSRST